MRREQRAQLRGVQRRAAAEADEAVEATSLRGGKTNEARSRARQALWPDENRRNAAVSKFPPRPGMMTLPELKREFAAALAMPPRGGARVNPVA